MLGKRIVEYWTAERMKNAVPEEMPSYPSTPENVDISAPSSPNKDDETTVLTHELDGEDATEQTKRYFSLLIMKNCQVSFKKQYNLIFEFR